MKTITLIVTIITSFTLNAQSYDYSKDIEDNYLEKIVVDNNDSLMIQFRDFAVDLFTTGTKVDPSVWENLDGNLVGVCLFGENDALDNRTISFNLYALAYNDDRIDDFHKRTYFGKGSEAIYCFYVKCNTEEEDNMLKNAVDSYLKKDSIPFTNGAYAFSKSYSSTDYSEKISQSDSISTIAMGFTYSYLRQNGNYLIQIESTPQDELEAGTEKIYSTDDYINNWGTISVFIIDEKDGKAYDVIFNE